jgi:hypothetical protein
MQRNVGVVLVCVLAACVVASALPSGFTYLPDVDSSIIVEMRYYTMHNFVGSPIIGYDTPQVCWIPPPSLLLYIFYSVKKTWVKSPHVWYNYPPAHRLLPVRNRKRKGMVSFL